MNKKQYRKKNAVLRKVIGRGMSVVCRVCATKAQVKPAEYYRGSARCLACGGLVDRVHKRGTEHAGELDARRVVPRKPGCKVRGKS